MRSLVLTYVILFLCCLLLLCWVQFFQYLAKRLAGKNVSEMTYFLLSGTQNLNLINLKLQMLTKDSGLEVDTCIVFLSYATYIALI